MRVCIYTFVYCPPVHYWSFAGNSVICLIAASTGFCLQGQSGHNSAMECVSVLQGSSDRFTMAPFLAMAASLMAQPEPPTDDEEKDKEGSERSQEVETATDYSIRLDELKE